MTWGFGKIFKKKSNSHASINEKQKAKEETIDTGKKKNFTPNTSKTLSHTVSNDNLIRFQKDTKVTLKDSHVKPFTGEENSLDSTRLDQTISMLNKQEVSAFNENTGRSFAGYETSSSSLSESSYYLNTMTGISEGEAVRAWVNKKELERNEEQYKDESKSITFVSTVDKTPTMSSQITKSEPKSSKPRTMAELIQMRRGIRANNTTKISEEDSSKSQQQESSSNKKVDNTKNFKNENNFDPKASNINKKINKENLGGNLKINDAIKKDEELIPDTKITKNKEEERETTNEKQAKQLKTSYINSLNEKDISIDYSKTIKEERPILKQANHSDDPELRNEIWRLREENSKLQEIANRLNSELDWITEKYSLKTSFQGNLSTSFKNFDLKQLSPLIYVYDQKIQEKNEHIKYLKIKLEDLTKKFETLLSEKNLNYDLLSPDLQKRVDSIQNQAKLVLAENKILSSELELKDKQLSYFKRLHITSIGRVTKKLTLCQTDRINLLNQIDILNENKEDVLFKYNKLAQELSHTIKLSDHVSQLEYLKKQLAELSDHYKKEKEELHVKLQRSDSEKIKTMSQNNYLRTENQRLLAEIKVLEKTAFK